MFDTYTCTCGRRYGTKESRMVVINGAKFAKRRKDCKPCDVSFYTAEIPIELAREILSGD